MKFLLKLQMKISMYMGVDNILKWPQHICCAFDRNIVNFHQDHSTTFVVLYDNIVVKMLVKLLMKIAMYMGVDNILKWPPHICCAFDSNIVNFYQDHCTTFVVLYHNIVVIFFSKITNENCHVNGCPQHFEVTTPHMLWI